MNDQLPAVRHRTGAETGPEVVERLTAATESLALAGRSQRQIAGALSVMETQRLGYNVVVSMRAVKRYTAKYKARWTLTDEHAEGDVRLRLIAAAEEVERNAIESSADARRKGDKMGEAAQANLRLRAIAQQAKLRGLDKSGSMFGSDAPVRETPERVVKNVTPAWEPDTELIGDVARILKAQGIVEGPEDDITLALGTGDTPAAPSATE